MGAWVVGGSGNSSYESLRQQILQLIPTLLGPILITGRGVCVNPELGLKNENNVALGLIKKCLSICGAQLEGHHFYTQRRLRLHFCVSLLYRRERF